MTAGYPPGEVDVLTRVAAIVDAHGGRPAIEDRGEVVRYAELWRWAAAIGEALRGQGIGPGDRVALALEKSAAYVAALLGVWMAGAALVPLPPELPARRRQRIVAEVAPAAILDAEAVAALRATAIESAPGSAADRLWRRPAADDLAYVLYTSGSTGAPKGVMVAHRGIPGLLRAQSEAFGLGPASRSLFVLSVAFDAAISDVGAALVSGATLVIVDPARLRDPASFVAVIEREAITYVDIPPAILAHLDPRLLPACLGTLVIGGEVCPPAAVRRVAEVVRVINVYGPTEATVCASLVACDPATWTRPLLGAPLPGVIFRVLAEAPDGSLRELDELGDEGELFIGGRGLAVGYLGRPELTAARFVTRAGERLYRTGDRVRIRREGLEFRGRVDRQRKIGGVRIELAEIEAELCRHPGVAEAAVVDADAERGGLVAAIVGRVGAPAPSIVALREHLGRGLPTAALPRRIVALQALPRRATGKVDFEALAQQLRASDAEENMSQETGSLGGSGQGDVEGATGLLAALWREVLGAPRVGPDDRFCQLGGGSLDALEVV
ncbi:MAG: non-ribosomal peptide synthetase, partial [Myxococcales bacterium]|nr:non-ribosomal peptide synthetase [Myxococcales bacterium]